MTRVKAFYVEINTTDVIIPYREKNSSRYVKRSNEFGIGWDTAWISKKYNVDQDIFALEVLFFYYTQPFFHLHYHKQN